MTLTYLSSLELVHVSRGLFQWSVARVTELAEHADKDVGIRTSASLGAGVYFGCVFDHFNNKTQRMNIGLETNTQTRQAQSLIDGYTIISFN